MSRSLTFGEVALLRGLFREMLPYDRLKIKVNTYRWGGRCNSVTPSGVPYMSQTIYVNDFAKAPQSSQWTFIHEHVHVWQYVHGQRVKTGAIGIWIRNLGRYEDGYGYRIHSETRFRSLNIEQQASVVSDYWYVTLGKSPLHNVGSHSPMTHYEAALSDFWSAGPATVAIS